MRESQLKSAITNPNSEIASAVKPDETKWETKIFAGGAVIAKEGATGPHWMTSDPVTGTTATWRKIDNDWLTSVEETEPLGQKIYNAKRFWNSDFGFRISDDGDGNLFSRNRDSVGRFDMPETIRNLKSEIRDLMGSLRNSVFSMLCLLALVISTTAQVNKTTEFFVCDEVEGRISAAVQITKIASRDFRKGECDFYFFTNDDWFSVRISKHKTRNESRRAFARDFDFLTLAETYPENVQKVGRNNFWNQTKGFRENDSDSLIMLRYKNINITLISSDFELILTKIEPVLRSIKYVHM